MACSSRSAMGWPAPGRTPIRARGAWCSGHALAPTGGVFRFKERSTKCVCSREQRARRRSPPILLRGPLHPGRARPDCGIWKSRLGRGAVRAEALATRRADASYPKRVPQPFLSRARSRVTVAPRDRRVSLPRLRRRPWSACVPCRRRRCTTMDQCAAAPITARQVRRAATTVCAAALAFHKRVVSTAAQGT